MDFITLLIILLALTLIIRILSSVKSSNDIAPEIDFDEDLQGQNLQRDEDIADEPFVPEIGLSRFVAILPEEHWGCFEHPSDEPYVIPQANSVIGDLRMMFMWQEAIVQVGKHTELRFETTETAFDFVDKVLRDEIVFRMGDEETLICPIEDFENAGEVDRTDHVWSGPLKYKLLFRS
jgi:hypothetical protein